MNRQEAALVALLAAVELLKQISADTKAIRSALEHPPEKDEWLDRYDLMSKLHISRSTLYRMKKAGLIKPTVLRGKEYYLLSAVAEIVRNQISNTQ